MEDTLKFLDTKLKENYAQVLDTEIKMRGLVDKIAALKNQLSQVSTSAHKTKRSIVIDLEILKPVVFDLNVSYLVKGAGWQPLYDARAFFQESKVELVSYGIVTQTTGEDWSEVDILLSTARPAIGGRMPYVSPWFLRPYQPRYSASDEISMKKTLERRDGSLQFEAFNMPTPTEKVIADKEVKYAAIEERGIAVVYKLPRKVSVKSDGSEHKLPISSQDLKAIFEYSSYPRAVLNAYLGSRVTNAPNLQLLSGRVNIFLEGDFVGISSIDSIGPGQEFDLYLGADENVKVKRECLEKKTDETLFAKVPSSSKRTTFKYKLTIENYKPKKIKIKLFESMPVSEDDRIKVKIASVSLEPGQKDWQDRKGVWLWEITLEPKAKQEIVYNYIIEHSREMRIEGL